MSTFRNGFRFSGWLQLTFAVVAVILFGAQGATAATGGAGASLPYVELQAENATTNGTVLPVTYTYNTLGGEASGRRAVTLTSAGQFVEFTLPSAANSIVVRYSIPDSGNGAVYTAPLAVFTGSSPGGPANTAQPNLTLTNAYSHFYGSYPFTNSPGTNHHHYYDDVSARLPNLAAGTLVRLQMLGSAASSVTIDFADFEQVAAAGTAPAGSITLNADATGQTDAAPAIRTAIQQAAGGTVWIPAGTYRVDSRIIVNNVTIRGAGMWHTILNFTSTGDNTGFHGNNQPNPSANVHISNLRMNGNIQQRNDDQQTNAFGQGFTNSSFTNVWAEHFKVGAWLFGPATNVVFTGVRFRNTNADGINFNGGFTNSLVTQSHFRNNGDDGLAMWSIQVNSNNAFTFNTVETTLLANGIAIYGGANNSVTDNRVIDTGLNQGGGIHVGNRFGAPALSGTTTIARNTLIRTGNLDTNWQFGVGSIWFDARDAAMSGLINVTNLLIQQAPYSAIMFISGSSITNVNFNDVTVQGVGTYVLQLQVNGSASFQNVVASNIGRAGVWNCLGTGFNVINNGGNDTWINSPLCQGTHPTPVFPPPAGGLVVTPTALDFGSQAVNTNSTARTVSVSNTGSSAAPISSIAASGDFSQSNNCGASVAANASCTVNVVFRPTLAGARSGSLSINSSAGNSAVALSGTGTSPGASIAAAPTSLTFTSPAVGSTSAAQAVTLTNTGTLPAAMGSILASGDFSQTNNCGGSLAVSASCTVNVTFTPTVAGVRTGTLTVSSDATNSPTTVALSGTTVPPNTNLAAGRPATASTTNSGFPTGNATDGNVNSYWESQNNAFPQTLTVELAQAALVGRVVLKLPPAWGTRSQTMSIVGGTDGTNFPITFAGSTAYQFVGGTNVVNIVFATPANARFVRLNITANTGWQAGQISEFEVYSASAPATLSASPSPVAFGSVTTNTFTTRAVTITNSGSASATVSGVSISGTGQFTQTNNCGALAASATCTVTVRFAPTTATSQTGTLTVASNASNPSLTVPLSGTGVPPGTATLSASPSPVAFGNQATNSSSTRAVTITNTGGASGNVTGVAVSGSGQFTQSNNCVGALAANASCTVTVTFAPTTATSQTGTLTVSSNASNPSLAVPLSGTGVPPGTATLSASPSPVTFGDQAINTSSSRTVTVTNTGTGAGAVSGVSVSGPFTQTNNCAALAAGATCTVTVTFNSANPLGAKSGTLTVSSNATNPSLAVPLSGNAIDPPVVGCTNATNVAVGKTPVASATTGAFVATNSNDNNLASYWEGPFPDVTLTVPLGTNYRICSVTVRLNPDGAWGQRTQTYSIEGRDQAGGTFTTLVGSAGRVFTPGTTAPGNNNTVSVNVPVTAALAADVRLTFTANTGAPGGQVAEVIIMGVPGPNPDLTISGVAFSPSSPTEITPITLSAMVNNIGTSASPVATTAKFFCGTAQVGGSANVGTLNAGASTPVSVNIGTQPASTCTLTARVDDPSLVVEQNEDNNSASGGSMVIAPIQSADLVPSTSWSPSSPSGGQTVTFSSTILNQGNQASSATPHTISVQIRNQAGTLVSTLSPASQPSGVIAANGGSVTVTAGTWVAVNGRYTVTTTVAPDQANEAPVKQANNTTTATLVVGLGANMPYDMYEAEDGTPGSGAVAVGPNRTIGDIAGEASGRRAVRLPSSGSSVQWTTRASSNTAVVRFSIPDNTTATLGVFNGATQVGTLNLVSKYIWLYGNEAAPQNSGTNPRHIYDEASVRLSATVPAGATLQVRNTSSVAVALDFLSLELATATGNPSPSTFVTVTGTDQQAIQNAINTANQNATMVGIFLPAGDYQMNSKINVSQKGLQIVGAGPWFTRIFAPQAGENNDIGFSFTGASANGAQVRNLALFGNFTNRQDGNGQMIQLFNVANVTMDNVWIEHAVPAIWTANVDNSTFTNLRLRNLFADGINFNNDSRNNTVRNSESRSSGDDSFAMFNAQDRMAGINSGNLFENLTSLLTWRAAGIAIYGGGGNAIRNIYIADTLTYPGVTISTINFDIPGFIGFSGITTFDNIAIVRGGGHFWGNQVFPAMWLHSGEGTFTGIRINNVDIQDPTYLGIMFQTKYVGGQPTTPILDTIFTNTAISGANDPRPDGSNVDSSFTFPVGNRAGNAIYCNPMAESGQGAARGSVTFNNLTMTNNTRDINNPCPDFDIFVNGGAALGASPGSLAFGDQAINTTSAARTITVTNTGTAAASISGVTVSGEYQQTTNCGGTLAANASCTVNVSFRPLTSGAKSGTVTVASNATNPALTVPLSGNGISNTATLSASPSPVAFGNQTTNTSSTRAVTITNTGGVSGNVTGVSISGGGQFTQTNNCGALAANASCTVTVTFAPTSATSQTGTLTIASNASNPSLAVPLSGTGVPPGTATLSASPSPVAFGNQVINTSSSRTVTVTNTGTAAGTVSGVSITGPFTQTNNCGALAANASCTVTVTFASAAPAGAKSGTLTVNSNATNPSLAVPLSGNAVTAGTATLSASPSPVAFGDQAINTSSPRAVTITNTGTGAGTVSGVTISGPFTQTNNCAALAAGATCTVTVTFNSANPLGAKSGTLTVSSNATNPSLAVPLSGNAIDPPVVGCANATNVAPGKIPFASATTGGFPAANSNDNNRNSYWEGPFPNVTLIIPLGTNYRICSITIQLNPSGAWGQRTQTYSIEGRDQAGGAFNTLVPLAPRQFTPGASPGNDNQVTTTVPTNLPLAADVRLTFTANTGAPGAQVAEVIIMAVPGPNPDLTASAVSFSPSSPNEVTPITVTATASNIGTSATPIATNAKAYCGGTQVGPAATVGILNAGASTPVSINIGTLPQGSCALSVRVDDPSVIVEQSEANNSGAGPTFTVLQAPGPDLEVLSIASNPANPAVGAPVTFSVTLNNRGTTAVAAGTTTRILVGSTTLNNTNSPQILVNTPTPVTISGSWTATSGGATITATADATNIVTETNEGNNTLSRSIVVGRGAAVPYVEYEAEAGTHNGTLEVANATRTFGHTNFGSESSGRQSVRLSSTGQFVEITSIAAANSIVVRNSIPDAGGGGGATATISLYVTPPGGSLTFVQKITLSSRNSWLYGTTDDTESLSNSPGPDARRLFDESNALLATSYPTGTRFRLQRDASDSAGFYIIDLIDLEQVAPPLAQPSGCVSITSAPYNATPNDNTDDTAAIQRAVMDDQNGVIQCVWIPAGRFRQEQKILTPDPTRGQFNQLGIRNVVIRGAGMWHSVLFTNTEPHLVVGGINHPHEGNVGFDVEDNVQISDLAIFGMTTNRANRGHGLNGRFGQNTRFTNLWIEHVNVGAWVGRDFSDTPAYWNPGIGLDFSGVRFRNLYADGINFSNGTRSSRVFNSSFRNTGDDSLAVWANPAVRNQQEDVGRDNVFINNTVQLPWRANGIAIYGGANNRVENNLIYDTMTFPGIMLATDHSPLPFSGTTLIANNGLFRCGGVFWGEAQEYGAITLFPSGQPIPGAVIRDTDIFDSTYDGIQFKTGGGEMPGVQITNVRIDASNNGGAGILAMGGARGSAVLTNVTITNSSSAHVGLNPGSQFVFSGSVNGAPVQPVIVQ